MRQTAVTCNMKKITLLVLFVFLNSLLVLGQNIPKNYVVIDSILGDLDNDNIKELVVVLNTKKAEKENENIPRELRIYKKINKKWINWKNSEQALYGSREGGMVGDPYAGIKIKNGILLISHFGGSSWKWGYTDKYRFQNENFYLIGYESNYGRPCDFWENVDFNLSTGKIIFEREFEDCEKEKIYKKENETFYEKKLKITLEKRQAQKIEITSPKYNYKIHL
ncbi:hypothetical protein [Mesonia aestuariivivens]|uniref:VCBS repeat-containing protein n=1 Tax=Mesonia aestuariivivens TaxID=2796128 RepID=A0ABS6W5I4_9FLAO|nr:hypothetical protein [Mesonia aestuariivivens]MBW2963132.1 hypothetical protein [Mesonia aestuariivivens]